MIKCLLSGPGLIAGPLHSTPLQIISQSIPRLDPIDSKSSLTFKEAFKENATVKMHVQAWKNVIVKIYS